MVRVGVVVMGGVGNVRVRVRRRAMFVYGDCICEFKKELIKYKRREGQTR